MGKIATVLGSESILKTNDIPESYKIPLDTMSELLGIAVEKLAPEDTLGNVVTLRR